MGHLIVFILFLTGCASLYRTEGPKLEPPKDIEVLERIYRANLSEYSFGFPSDCDSALWAGVAKCGGARVDLSGYLYPGNQPQRRVEESCYPTDANGDGRPDSRSTISNDGIIGLSMCDSRISNNILNYGIENDFFMGEPRSALGEVVLKPNVRIVMEGRDTPTIYAKPKEDYQFHIQVQLILWEGRTYGKISKNALERLEDAVKAYPGDCLFNAALGLYTGDMSRATELALGPITPSSYVRGDDRYIMANWLQCVSVILTTGE